MKHLLFIFAILYASASYGAVGQTCSQHSECNQPAEYCYMGPNASLKGTCILNVFP